MPNPLRSSLPFMFAAVIVGLTLPFVALAEGNARSYEINQSRVGLGVVPACKGRENALRFLRALQSKQRDEEITFGETLRFFQPQVVAGDFPQCNYLKIAFSPITGDAAVISVDDEGWVYADFPQYFVKSDLYFEDDTSLIGQDIFVLVGDDIITVSP